MEIFVWLQKAEKTLKLAGIGTARLDALVLLEDAVKRDRAYISAHPETPLTEKQISLLNKQIKSRKAHEPLAYIRGKTEFFGRDFIVRREVLEPRPESETMIELLKSTVGRDTQLTDDKKLRIADIGSGSGALAITAKLELPKTEVFSIDIDPKTIEVARQNAQKHTVAIHFLRGDLLTPLHTKGYTSQILLCNLPYVPDSYQLNKAAMKEPRLAIYGGRDGLDLYRRLFEQVRSFNMQPLYIFTESLPFQHADLAVVAKASGYVLHKTNDFIQIFIPEGPLPV